VKITTWQRWEIFRFIDDKCLIIVISHAKFGRWQDPLGINNHTPLPWSILILPSQLRLISQVISSVYIFRQTFSTYFSFSPCVLRAYWVVLLFPIRYSISEPWRPPNQWWLLLILNFNFMFQIILLRYIISFPSIKHFDGKVWTFILYSNQCFKTKQ
jgi:hypothetical protein